MLRNAFLMPRTQNCCWTALSHILSHLLVVILMHLSPHQYHSGLLGWYYNSMLRSVPTVPLLNRPCHDQTYSCSTAQLSGLRKLSQYHVAFIYFWDSKQPRKSFFLFTKPSPIYDALCWASHRNEVVIIHNSWMFWPTSWILFFTRPAHLAIRFPTTVPQWPLLFQCQLAFVCFTCFHSSIVGWSSISPAWLVTNNCCFLSDKCSPCSRVIELVQWITAWIWILWSSVISCPKLTE